VIGQGRFWWRALAAVFALALVAAACGSDADDDATGTETEDSVDASDDEPSEDEETETSEPADDADDANDADDDADADTGGDSLSDDLLGTIENNFDAAWGIEDNVLSGPAGFSIDLNECPSDWSDTAGITDTEIRIGGSFAQSGTLAGFFPWIESHDFLFNHLNKTEGGIDGREIIFEIKDDAYEPARAVTNVQELIETFEPFAFSTLGGTPNNLAVYDEINDACIPQMFSATGHPAWGDPVEHPWTIGSFLAYNTEARIWGQAIIDAIDAGELTAPVDVAALVMNNDFGLAYKDAFEGFVEDNPDSFGEITFELHDPSAPNVVNENTTLAGTEASVAIIMSTGVYCTQTFDGVAQSSWEPSLKFVSATCSGIESWFQPAGQNGAGWRLTASEKDLNDPAFADDETLQKVKAIIEDAGGDPSLSNHAKGMATGIPTVEALKRASLYPGGLTRTNLMLAIRSADFQSPMNLDGILWKTNGNDDAYPSEGALITEYTIEAGEELGSHVPVSEIVSVEGTSGTCVYDGISCG